MTLRSKYIIYEYKFYLNIGGAMLKKGIIFDLDGTLWDSSEQVVPAWNIVFNRYHELNKSISLADMKSFMGKTIEDIAGVLLPNIDRHKRTWW